MEMKLGQLLFYLYVAATQEIFTPPKKKQNKKPLSQLIGD
jgi:hypothetical protein